jgi:hypothetical protein
MSESQYIRYSDDRNMAGGVRSLCEKEKRKGNGTPEKDKIKIVACHLGGPTRRGTGKTTTIRPERKTHLFKSQK